MSPSPEKNSIPDKPSQAPTAGENPNTAGHLGKIPYDTEPLGMHHDEDTTVDTGQIAQVIASPNELQDGRTPAQELPTPKNNRLRNTLLGLGAGATAIAIAAGAWIGVSANNKDDTTPKSETTAGAPTQPGQPTSPAETKPAQTTPGEGQPKPVEEWKFYNADGTFMTADQVKREAAVNPNLYRTVDEALNGAFEHIEAAVNYFPDRKTVLEALNITEDQLSTDDFVTVAKQYQKLSFDTVVRGNGEFREWLDIIGINAISDRITSILNEDKVEYHVSISQDIIKTETITVTDNSALSGVQREPSLIIGTYKITSTGGNDFVTMPAPAGVDRNTYINSRTFAGNIGMTKVEAK